MCGQVGREIMVTESVMEGELISSYLYEESLIAESTIQEITLKIFENTNSRSRFRPHRCSCMTCPDGPDRGKQRCKGANGKCSSIPCITTALPIRSASPSELISTDFIE
jgi:hypothetical protein